MEQARRKAQQDSEKESMDSLTGTKGKAFQRKGHNGESSREELTGLSTKSLNAPRKSSLKVVMKNPNLTLCSDQCGRNV